MFMLTSRNSSQSGIEYSVALGQEKAPHCVTHPQKQYGWVILTKKLDMDCETIKWTSYENVLTIVYSTEG